MLEKNHDPQKNHNQDIINKNLNSLADKFKIILPTNENKNFYLNFNWYNYDQGKEIFDEALFQAKKKC